jgi:hypothetical protein
LGEFLRRLGHPTRSNSEGGPANSEHSLTQQSDA